MGEELGGIAGVARIVSVSVGSAAQAAPAHHGLSEPTIVTVLRADHRAGLHSEPHPPNQYCEDCVAVRPEQESAEQSIAGVARIVSVDPQPCEAGGDLGSRFYAGGRGAAERGDCGA